MTTPYKPHHIKEHVLQQSEQRLTKSGSKDDRELWSRHGELSDGDVLREAAVAEAVRQKYYMVIASTSGLTQSDVLKVCN